jgi:hypothetical protein
MSQEKISLKQKKIDFNVDDLRRLKYDMQGFEEFSLS